MGSISQQNRERTGEQPPKTLNLKPYTPKTQNPKPRTLNPKLYTLNPPKFAWNLRLQTGVSHVGAASRSPKASGAGAAWELLSRYCTLLKGLGSGFQFWVLGLGFGFGFWVYGLGWGVRARININVYGSLGAYM